MDPVAVNGAGSPSAQESASAGAGEEILALLDGGEGDGEFEFAEDEGTEAGEDEGAEVEDADSGGTEDDRRSQSIPRNRFDQVLGERNQLREQNARLAPYESFVQALSEQGLTPEQATELAGQIARGEVTVGEVNEAVQEAQQAQEDAAFEQWARQELGVEDIYGMSDVEMRLARREFVREGEARQQQQTNTLTQIKTDFESLLGDFPELKSPRVRKAFLNDYGAEHGIRSNPAAMRKHAEEFTAELKTLGRNQLSEEALAEAEGTRKRPNTSGGDSLGLGGNREWIEDLSPEGEERFQQNKRSLFQRLFNGARG